MDTAKQSRRIPRTMIKDYETHAALVKSLRQEIADLKEELIS